MSLLDRGNIWRATPVAMRRMLIEAALELLRARLVVGFRLKHALPLLLKPTGPEAIMPPVPLQLDVRYILGIAVRTVPWKSRCLANAIAAKRMLLRRGYASTLRLGVGHSSLGDPHAHAWLEAGDRVIIGEDGMTDITPFPGVLLRSNES